MRTMPRERLRTSLEDRGPPETVRHAGGSEASLSLPEEVGKTRVESLDVTLVA
jgi:hypothetical protein